MLIWACFRHCVYQYRVVGTSVISGAFTTECSLEHLRAHSKSQLEAAVWAADSRSEAGQGCLPHRDGSGFCVKAVRGPTDVRPKTSFWGGLGGSAWSNPEASMACRKSDIFSFWLWPGTEQVERMIFVVGSGKPARQVLQSLNPTPPEKIQSILGWKNQVVTADSIENSVSVCNLGNETCLNYN